MMIIIIIMSIYTYNNINARTHILCIMYRL